MVWDLSPLCYVLSICRFAKQLPWLLRLKGRLWLSSHSCGQPVEHGRADSVQLDRCRTVSSVLHGVRKTTAEMLGCDPCSSGWLSLSLVLRVEDFLSVSAAAHVSPGLMTGPRSDLQPNHIWGEVCVCSSPQLPVPKSQCPALAIPWHLPGNSFIHC